MTQTLTTARLKALRETLKSWLDGYDSVDDKEQCGMFEAAISAVAELLASREAQPVAFLSKGDVDTNQPHILARRYKSLACTMPVYTAPPAPAVASGEDCWSCGKFFTYAQRSECDGYCPHCDAPVDLDESEEDTDPPAVTSVTVIPEAATLTNINQLCPLDNNLSQTDFATGWNDCRQYAITNDGVPPVIKGVHAAAQGWNACRAAMLAAVPGVGQ